MTNQEKKNNQAYIRPAMEVVDIEMQQAILNASQTEDLGDKKEEIEWTNRRRGTWGNLWTE